MENETQLTPVRKRSKAKLAGLITIVLLLIACAGAGSYSWQHKKVNDLDGKVSQLQTELNKGSTTQTTTSKQPIVAGTFTYSPKTGGLSLTLPKTYGVIVNVDGNKGGAPGATFRVATVNNSNTFEDASYQGVQVDVDNTFTTLGQAVSSEESQLDKQRGAGSTVDRNYKVSDTTVAGLPAKLVTADGLDEYQGQVSVYLVGAGSFTYTITANGSRSGTPAVVTAVLKGISLKAVNL